MARAGLYRERITLLLAGTVESDGMGGWLPVGEGEKVPTWARIRQLKGGQLLALGREITTELYQITIRYRADASQADRLSWGSRTMKILSQATDERRTEITLYASNAR